MKVFLQKEMIGGVAFTRVYFDKEGKILFCSFLNDRARRAGFPFASRATKHPYPAKLSLEKE